MRGVKGQYKRSRRADIKTDRMECKKRGIVELESGKQGAGREEEGRRTSLKDLCGLLGLIWADGDGGSGLGGGGGGGCVDFHGLWLGGRVGRGRHLERVGGSSCPGRAIQIPASQRVRTFLCWPEFRKQPTATHFSAYDLFLSLAFVHLTRVCVPAGRCPLPSGLAPSRTRHPPA